MSPTTPGTRLSTYAAIRATMIALFLVLVTSLLLSIPLNASHPASASPLAEPTKPAKSSEPSEPSRPSVCAQPGLLIADMQPLSYPYNSNSARQIANTISYSYNQSNIITATNQFALFQAHDPYNERGYPTYIKNAITSSGHTYQQFSPSALQGFNFSNYRVVLLLWDAQNSIEFVTPYQASLTALQDYITSGGVVWIQGGIYSGSFPLPFGGTATYGEANANYIPNGSHPVTQGLSNPYTGNLASHGTFSGLPAGANTIIGRDAAFTPPTAYEYRPVNACPSSTPTTPTPTVTGTPPTNTPTTIPTSTSTPIPGVWCVDAQGRSVSPPCTGSSGVAFRTIQEAIDVARSGDEIRIAAGTYYGQGTAVGVIDKDISFIGGYPGGANGWTTPGDYTLTSVNGQGERNGFKIQGGATVSINNLSITSGGIENNGTVTIDDGTLRINGVGTINGHYVVAANSLLYFSCICTLADGTTITGPGAAQLSYFTNSLDIPGAATVQNFNLTSGSITGTGTLTATGVFSWTGGGMVGTGITNIAPSAQLNIAYSTGFIVLDNHTLNNAGTTTWINSAQFYLYNASVFNNNNLFVAKNTLGLGGAGIFNNAGTFRKASDVSNVDINNSISFNNSGTINIPNGTLSIASSSLAFNMLAGSQATGSGFLKVGSHFSALVNIAGPTTMQNLNFAGGTITGTNTLTVTGVLSWTGGTMSGTGMTNIPPSTQLNISGSTASVALDKRTLNNAGTANWLLATSIYLRNGGTFNNIGLFDVQNTLSVADVGGIFNNSGTLRKRAGFNFTGSNALTFNNLSTGVIDIAAGQMYFYQFSNAGGKVLLNGGTFTGTQLNLQAGTLSGVGTVSNNLINSGIVAPGSSPGTITSTTYTQYTTGTLRIDLGGPAPGTQHDQLRVTGAATLAGTLNLTLVNGYTPNVGDTFTIMTYSSHTGTFSSIDAGCTGGTFSATYNANNVVITVLTIGGPVCTPTPTPTLPPPTATPSPTPCTAFTDVPVGSTFYPFITCLVNRGIVNGYADCTFRPNNNVTRGQLSKIVSLAAGFTDPPGAQLFEDVLPGSTFYTYVQQLASRTIISGYTCGGTGEPCIAPNNRPYFRPNSNASRGQISKIVANAANLTDPPGAQIFQDVLPGSTFYDYIQRLANLSIIGGYACGGTGEPCVAPDNHPYFRPNSNASRGQVSKIVANTFFPNCQP